MGFVGFLYTEAKEWSRANLSLGFSELSNLVRESSRVALAPGAWDYLKELGHTPHTVGEGYGLLVSLLAHH